VVPYWAGAESYLVKVAYSKCDMPVQADAFLEPRYGNLFDPAEDAVRVHHGGVTKKPGGGPGPLQDDSGNTDPLLYIEDPQVMLLQRHGLLHSTLLHVVTVLLIL
jgi:hypothetical protein